MEKLSKAKFVEMAMADMRKRKWKEHKELAGYIREQRTKYLHHQSRCSKARRKCNEI